MSSGPDIKEQVRAAIDIVDLVGGDLSLRRQGRVYKALCPWHDDSDPSLQVSPERQSWRCWVCNDGGDIFTYVMKREGVGFREALVMLAERAGISMNAGKPAEPGSPEDKNALFRAMAWAEQQYHRFLLEADEAQPARDYLSGRGISAESVKEFHIGYAPESWQWLFDQIGSTSFTAKVLEAAGLARVGKSGGYYDFFRGRVMFPVRDTQNRCVAFGGRILPEIAKREEAAGKKSGKYINSPDTRLFNKSQQLFALDLARTEISKQRQVLVMEGFTDVIMGWQHNITNAVAVLGTALGQGHTRMLKRFADTVVLVLDGDEAGRKRTNEILEMFIASDVDLRVLTLPEGADPCDFLQQHGEDAFGKLVTGASDALQHRIEQATTGVDLVRDTHKANQALEEILTTISKAPRISTGNASANILREQQILPRLARAFRLEESQLRTRLTELRKRRPAQREFDPRESHYIEQDGEPLERPTRYDLSAQACEVFEILIQRPDLVEPALCQIDPASLGSQPARRIFATYAKLYEAGEELDFTRMLAELSPIMQPLYVNLSETADAKTAAELVSAETRLADLVEYFERQQSDHHTRRLESELDEGRHNEKEETVLTDIFGRLKQAHGFDPEEED